MDTRGHTPTPWSRAPDERFGHDGSAGIRGPDGIYVATVLDHNRADRDAEVEATAAFIVQAVNAHDDLLGALREAVHMINTGFTADVRKACPEWYGVLSKATAAIVKATGGNE